MDLKRLRQLIDQLIEEQGEDAPVAAFVFSAADVAEATKKLGVKGDSDPTQILHEFMHNAGDPPYEDYLLAELEQLIADAAGDSAD